MSEYEKMAERLERQIVLRQDEWGKTVQRVNPDGPEAAAIIRRLVAENERLRSLITFNEETRKKMVEDALLVYEANQKREADGGL